MKIRSIVAASPGPLCVTARFRTGRAWRVGQLLVDRAGAVHTNVVNQVSKADTARFFRALSRS
jgi:hypothetical protein